MTALCIVLALAFFGLLFSRVHFHFSFNLTMSRQAGIATQRSKPGKPRRELSSVPPAVRSIDKAESDILSALLNLGCQKEKARQVAQRAMGQGKDFDGRLQWALRNAA